MTHNAPINVLLIEDNPTDIRLVQEILRGTVSDRFIITSASTLTKGLELLSSDQVDVILLDLGLPDSQGLDSLRHVKARTHDIPIIVLTISATEALGIEAVREGAQQFFSKDVLTPDGAYAEMFPHVIHFAIEQKRVEAALLHEREEVQKLNAELQSKTEELRVANERLEQRVEERTEELRETKERLEVYSQQQAILNLIVAEGNRAPNLREALRAMIDIAMKVADVDYGAVYLLNKSEGTIELQYAHGISEDVLSAVRRLPETTSYYQYVYEGRALFFDDFARDGTEQFKELFSELHTAAVIPLIAQDRAIGHYLLGSSKVRGFSDEEKTLLVAAGHQVGTVIARLQAEEATKEHARRQDILTRIISAGNSATSLQSALAAMLGTALELFSLDNGGIFLRDGDAMTLQYEHGYSTEQRTWTQRIPITQRRVARIMDGTPWISDDYQADVTPDVREMNKDVASMATVPLMAGGTVVGFYQLVSLRHPHYFTDEERGLLVAIGREAGTVIARLQTQEVLTYELAITETITRLTPPLLSPSLDFDGLVLAILDDAKRLTGSAHGFIALIDPLTKELVSRGHTQMLLEECAIPAAQRPIRFPIGPDGKYHALSTYAINERKGFFTNAPAEHPASTGTPDGHVPLERFLAVPALVSDEIVGEIALANPERDYTERDVVVVGRLAEELLSLAVQRMRAEEEIQHYAHRLEDLVEERTTQLTQSEEYFRTLFEASSIGQIHYGADGHPLRINRAAAAFFGINDVSDIQHLTIFSSPQTSEETKARLRAGHFVRYEHVYDFKEISERGSFQTTRSDVRYVDLYMLPLVNASDNTVEGYFAQMVDITERRRAEEALRASEEQYRTLVETANSIIITMKSDRTITFVNNYGAQFFGYTPDELIGKDIMMLVPEVESTGRPLEQHVRDILARPDEHATNLNENVTKDGQRLWVQWVNRGLTDHDGRHVGHLAIGIDVTALKHTEAALKEAERLAAIGQTATMIGHDLRNPLQALQLTVDLGHRYLGAIPPEWKSRINYDKAEQLFSSVEQQIQYMDKIVSDLQDYARPLTLEREVVSVPFLIANTLSAIAIPELIDTCVDASDSIVATVDPHFMQRALSNLIMNAVQAMPQGGELTINAAAENHAVVITVHDTGEGVPENMKDTLFSPLTTGKAKGTGLGLAVVKRIVEAHGGTITFESRKGKGTTFTVTLPQTAE